MKKTLWIGMIITWAALISSISLSQAASPNAARPTLKAGVLKFGTVSWELSVIKDHKLDQAEGFTLEVIPFAGKQASVTALHGGSVDMIVHDWIWTSRQRAMGQDFSFIPYSRMVGAVMADPARKIKALPDFKGKKIGIAGGPLDKSWLLLQSVAMKDHGFDLAKNTDVVFGAPPLLSKKLESGELDGVITFWHYAARLQAKGYDRVTQVKDTLDALGVDSNVPMIGYVFGPRITLGNQALIDAMGRASAKAKQIMLKDAAVWQNLRPLMKVKDDQTFQALRQGFLDGIPAPWTSHDKAEAEKLYSILAKIGGAKLIGKTQTLSPGTFYAGLDRP